MIRCCGYFLPKNRSICTGMFTEMVLGVLILYWNLVRTVLCTSISYRKIVFYLYWYFTGIVLTFLAFLTEIVLTEIVLTVLCTGISYRKIVLFVVVFYWNRSHFACISNWNCSDCNDICTEIVLTVLVFHNEIVLTVLVFVLKSFSPHWYFVLKSFWLLIFLTENSIRVYLIFLTAIILTVLISELSVRPVHHLPKHVQGLQNTSTSAPASSPPTTAESKSENHHEVKGEEVMEYPY